MNQDFQLSSYKFHLPQEQIAQFPADRRDESRLLVLDRETGQVNHTYFKEITKYVRPGDCLVLNKTKVIPARLLGHKATGGKVEILLLNLPDKIEAPGIAQTLALCRSSKPLKPGQEINFGDSLAIRILGRTSSGKYKIQLRFEGDLLKVLDEVGHVPLPPYIRRESRPLDRDRYQTVYARDPGSVAAPTAGLHFSKDLLSALEDKGVKIVPVVLHVGYGTFSPIRCQDIREHKIHSEWISISDESARAINEVKQGGGRVICVGTTSVRTVEYAARHSGRVEPYTGECDLYIYPGFRFKVVDAMLTNFHLPYSSLLILVSAFAGRELILSVYEEAVELGYRFFSYGDAMLIT